MPTATTRPTSAPLPPPHLFDILPPLHSLLTRLLLPPSPTDGVSPSPDSATPMSPKDLATAASSITNKIQKARSAVRDLPGVEMGVEEQEDVIAELEEESRRLRGVEEGIRRAAREVLEGVASGVAVGNAAAAVDDDDDVAMET